MRFKSLFVSCCLVIVLCAASRGAERPNILVILLDDMGYGDAACYNSNSKIPTPHIDRLAKEGMRFTDAHSAGSLCHPSRYGLMTGQHPWRTNTGVWKRQPVIKEGRLTVGSFLQSQGYRTAMVGKWHLGFKENGYDKPLPGGPVDRGFNSYFGMRASTDIPPYFYIRGKKAVAPPTDHIAANNTEGWSRIQGEFWRAGGIAPGLEIKDMLPAFTDETIKVIESYAEANKKDKKPFFLYSAYTGPHTPWLPSSEYVGESGAGMYGDFTMMIDAEIGRILRTLDKHDFTKNTMVILSSDNGPVWYEVDRQKYDHDCVGGLRGMKGDAWEGGHRMPFIVRWPGQVEAGALSDHLVNFTDLLATCADICGVELPKEAGPDSFSFLPALKGEIEGPRPVMVMKAGHYFVRSGEWKLIKGLGSGGFSKPSSIKPKKGEVAVQLYDLSKDISETTNLAAEYPERVKALLAELQSSIDKGRSRNSR